MKKLVFAVMAMVAITFASCGNKTTSSEVVNDSDSVAVDTVVVDSIDSVATDTVVTL